MTDERLKECRQIIEMTSKDSVYSEIGNDLLNEITTLQQQNKQLKSLIDHIEIVTSDGYVRTEIRKYKAIQGGTSNDN